MWKRGRLLHLLEHWHLLLCHNEHDYHSISLLALVELHRLSICLDGWYLCCFTTGKSIIVMCWTRGTGVCYISDTSTTLSMGCACLCIGTSKTLTPARKTADTENGEQLPKTPQRGKSRGEKTQKSGANDSQEKKPTVSNAKKQAETKHRGRAGGKPESDWKKSGVPLTPCFQRVTAPFGLSSDQLTG